MSLPAHPTKPSSNAQNDGEAISGLVQSNHLASYSICPLHLGMKNRAFISSRHLPTYVSKSEEWIPDHDGPLRTTRAQGGLFCVCDLSYMHMREEMDSTCHLGRISESVLKAMNARGRWRQSLQDKITEPP